MSELNAKGKGQGKGSVTQNMTLKQMHTGKFPLYSPRPHTHPKTVSSQTYPSALSKTLCILPFSPHKMAPRHNHKSTLLPHTIPQHKKYGLCSRQGRTECTRALKNEEKKKATNTHPWHLLTIRNMATRILNISLSRFVFVSVALVSVYVLFMGIMVRK